MDKEYMAEKFEGPGKGSGAVCSIPGREPRAPALSWCRFTSSRSALGLGHEHD